ncbi:AraC family transcriptional regulator [Streptomyces sp. NPDC055078]
MPDGLNPGRPTAKGGAPAPETVALGTVDWDFPRPTAGVLLLTEFAAEHGIERARCLDGSGVAPEALGDARALVQAHQEITVARNLVTALGDRPGLGLEVGSRFRLTTHGIWGYAVMNSPTMREAVRLGVAFASLTYLLTALTVEVDSKRFAVRVDGSALPANVRRFLVERDCAAVVAIRRELLGRAGAPLRRVRMGLPTGSGPNDTEPYDTEPYDTEPYEKFFCAPVSFGSGPALLEADRSFLDRLLPHAHPHTAQLCTEICRRQVEQRTRRGGAAQAVRARLLARGGADDGIDRSARDLGVTSRTLRRWLAKEGVGYRQLVDEVRFAVAQQLLGLEGVSTGEVARRLGYAEAGSFIRAFRRWGGTTPQDWATAASGRAPLELPVASAAAEVPFGR